MKKLASILAVTLLAFAMVFSVNSQQASAAEVGFGGVILTSNGENYKITMQEYNAAVGLGLINSKQLSYVELTNGKIYSMQMYNAAVGVSASAAGARVYLNDKVTPNPPAQYKIGAFSNGQVVAKDGQVIKPGESSDFEIVDIY